MNPIVVPENFIRATRDTGYRTVAYAVAELIDNALDGGASNVNVLVREEWQGIQREITIAVLDDGKGMDTTTLAEALRFGGSERFNGRSRLGRYGMGLPNSSVSQAPRVDVFTWRLKDEVNHTFLDVEEIASRRQRGVPNPRRYKLPDWVNATTPTGTLVVWSRCDKLRYKRSETIAEKLLRPLGRMYRMRIAEGTRITVNSFVVTAVDPLFRSELAEIRGTSRPFGKPLIYRLSAVRGPESLVSVQFVELPVSRWHRLSTETKRAAGMVGGAGMSVLRSGREIDYGWMLFGDKRKENYDDWWRCELRFEPALDEFFGITHTKQGINPSPELREILEPDLERISRELSGRVRKAFQTTHRETQGAAERRASNRDRFLPATMTANQHARRSGTSGYRYKIGIGHKPVPEFFTMHFHDSTLLVDINEHHPFYQKAYVKLAVAGANETIELLLLAAARALADVPASVRPLFLRKWSDALAAFLDC